MKAARYIGFAFYVLEDCTSRVREDFFIEHRECHREALRDKPMPNRERLTRSRCCEYAYRLTSPTITLLTCRLLGMKKEQLLLLADAYKEQVFAELLEMVPRRVATLDPSVLEDKATEEILALVYMQGVAEALDAFDMAELLRTIAREAQDSNAGMQA